MVDTEQSWYTTNRKQTNMMGTLLTGLYRTDKGDENESILEGRKKGQNINNGIQEVIFYQGLWLKSNSQGCLSGSVTKCPGMES